MRIAYRMLNAVVVSLSPLRDPAIPNQIKPSETMPKQQATTGLTGKRETVQATEQEQTNLMADRSEPFVETTKTGANR